MKKLYIYILIGLVCFLGFNGEVEAEYKAICKYSYEGTVHSATEDRMIIDAELLYDKSQTEPFELIVTTKEEDLDYNNEEDNLSNSTPYTFHFQNIDPKGKYSKNALSARIYSYDGMVSATCPKYLKINSKNPTALCFYNGSNGKDWCNVNASGGFTLEGSAIKEQTYNGINEGAICNKSVGTDGDSGQTFAYVQFKYTNGGLDVSYKTSESGELKKVVGGVIKVTNTTKSASGNPDKDRIDTRNIYLTNANADLHSDPVILDTRAEFDTAYLKEWQSTGKCPVLEIDPDGYGTNYWLLLPDAVKDIEKYGSSKVDVDALMELPDWNYDWKNWFDLRNEYDDCEGLLGDDIMELLDEIFLYVKILIPVALIGFGIVDFVKAVFSSKEEDMKKAQNRFIKRLIIAAIIFILPSIVNALLNTIDGIWAHINNSACNIWD